MSLESEIGYYFKNKEFLKRALTHKSYTSEHGLTYSNERLEFLGDSVLGLVVSVHLFRAFPEEDEGFLSKLKSYIVSRKNLALWARKLNLGKHVLMGEGEITSGGKKRASILSNAMEALIGALYLDGGLDFVSLMVEKWLENFDFFSEALRDYKSELQEIMQKKHKTVPEYVVVAAEGPQHDKTFTVKVRVKHRLLGLGRGKNKKEAEQKAARDALGKFCA